MVQFRNFDNLEDVEFASDEVFMFESLHYFDGVEVITLDKPFQLIHADDIYVMTETIRENVLYNNCYCKINMENPHTFTYNINYIILKIVIILLTTLIILEIFSIL